MTKYDPIAAAAARNRVVAIQRAAGTPEVGIWWFIDGKMVADSIPWTEAPEHAGFYNGNSDHHKLWTRVQRFLPKLRDSEYTDFPRGRVVYDKSKTNFMCYGSKKSTYSTPMRRRILTEFKLPLAQTKFLSDLHYEDPTSDLFDD